MFVPIGTLRPVYGIRFCAQVYRDVIYILSRFMTSSASKKRVFRNTIRQQ